MPQKVDNYNLGIDRILLHKNIIFVPNVQDLKHMILHEIHNVPYAGHPGYQKTMAVVKSHYFWPGMKREFVEYITRCIECQKVKAEHRHPVGLLHPDGILLHKNIVFVPNVHDLKRMILNEMHNVHYAGHPGYQKTVAVVKIHYCWPGMKREIIEYIARCMECQKFKANHRHPAGLLQPFPILE
jgi:hypothetical protein